MSKIITIWGNPGCGKSMFCCILAKVLTANKQKAIIINADPATPCFRSGCRGGSWSKNASIGGVLSSLEINSAVVAERVAVLKDYPFIGVMGYAAGETPFFLSRIKV